MRDKAFYSPGNLKDLVVLDPFVGGGTSVVEAAKCGASVIGVDIDPVACFTTAKELAPWDERVLREAYQEVERKVKEKVLSWYSTVLPDGRKGTLIYGFWVDVVTCPNCQRSFDGHPHYQLFRNRTTKRQTVACAKCGLIADVPLEWKTFCCGECHHRTAIGDGPIGAGKFSCPECGMKTVLRDMCSNTAARIPQRLFAVEVLVDGTGERVFKRAGPGDLQLFRKAAVAWEQRRTKDRFVPTEEIPVEDRDDARPLSYGYLRYSELFNSRQLLCLSLIAEAIAGVRDVSARELLAVAFSDCLAANNMFCFFAFDYRKLTPLFGLHAYTKVSRPVENNVWGVKFGRGTFSKCFEKVVRGKRYADAPYEYRYSNGGKPERVTTGERIANCPAAAPSVAPAEGRFAALLNRSSEDLGPIGTGTIDLILTDPPYYNNLPYSELSDFYHVWLRRLDLPGYPGNERAHTPLAESLYVRNETNVPKEHDRYCDGLARALAECARVLKDDGLLVFTFHHNERSAWIALASAVIAAGFKVSNAFPVRSEGQSRFHSYEGSLKWDVVFCCRKKSRAEAHQNATALDGRGLNPIARRTRKRLTSWTQKLRRNKLDFSNADAKSLRYGLVCMYLSRRLGRPSEVTAAFEGVVNQFEPAPQHAAYRK